MIEGLPDVLAREYAKTMLRRQTADDRFLIDARSDTVVVLGPNELDRKTRLKMWVPAQPSQVARLKEALTPEP